MSGTTDLVPCAGCGKETHGTYWTDRWQIRRDTVGVNPDGTTVLSTPFGAVVCSAECGVRVLSKLIPASEPEPFRIEDTCCGKCPGDTCYVDRVTGA